MKKLFALGLAACMLLGTCAPAAFAAEEPAAAVVEPATPESARVEKNEPVVSTFSATPAVQGVAPLSEPALSFRVTTEDGVTFTSDDPFATMTMVEGKTYTLQILLDGEPLGDTHPYSLAGAAIPENGVDTLCLEVTSVDTQNGTVTIKPLAVTSTPIFLGTLRLDIRDNANSTTSPRFFTCIGSVVSDNGSVQFVNDATGAPVSTVKAGPNNKDLTLRLTGVDESAMSIEYSTTVPASVTWSTDGQSFGTVKVTVGQALGSNCFFMARVTDKATGELVNTAVLELEWYDDTVGPSDALDNGYRLYFGSKSGDDYYAFSTSSYTQLAPGTADPYFTTTLNVFFGIEESGNLYPTYTAMPEGCDYDIQVNSPDGALEILSTTAPSGAEPFAVTIKFRGDACTTATLQATVTSGGRDYTATYVINVVESAQTQEVTVQNAEDLKQALANPALVPNSVITLESGIYQGDFTVTSPVTLVADGLDGTKLPYDKETGALDTTTGVTIQGTLIATCEGVSVKGLRFSSNTNTETALKNPTDVQNCTFAGYETAIALDDGLRSSTNHLLYNNGFKDCGTAIAFVDREWRSQIQNNSFLNCDVAIALGANCQVDGIQSNVYNTTINGGKWTNNLFRGEDGDRVLKDDRTGSGAMATATLLLTYNYYDENTRQDSAFDGSYCIHDVFYTSPDMAAVTTSKPLEDVAAAGGLNLVAQTSGSPAPDSALNVTGDLFAELEKSNTDELQLKVWDLREGQEALAATWNFAKEDLTSVPAQGTVNLGVDAELDSYEQDIVDKALASGTTYQPISFDHSGALPGTATVDVPMAANFADTDNLMLYYIDESTGELDEIGPVAVENGNLEFSIEHCSSYVVKSGSSASAGDTDSTTTNKDKDTGSQAAGSTAPAPKAAPKPDTTVYYTCQACGYHNWTATQQGYRCDNCGYLETAKQLSGYGNVKGLYDPAAAAQTAAATAAIPQTGETGQPMAWVVLLAASALGLSGALVRKHRRNR